MTNVPGPQKPLFLSGSAIETLMFWVPQSGRLGLGISYRITAGADNERTLGTDMGGYAATFTLMYGKI